MMKKVMMCAGFLLALGACTRDNIISSRKGGEISFHVSSRGAATKTVYSGDRSTSGGTYERLDWESGDMFVLYCDQAAWPEPFANDSPSQTQALNQIRSMYATPRWPYTIDGNGPDDRYDKTTATGTFDRGLVWDKTQGTHHFFAVYPGTVPLLNRHDQNYDEGGPLGAFGMWFENARYMHEYDYDNNQLILDENEAIDFEVALVDVPMNQTVRSDGFNNLKENTTTGGTSRNVYEFEPAPVPMAAYTAADPSSDDNNPTAINLSFSPLLTTLRIELKGEAGFPQDKKLTMLELYTENLNEERGPLRGCASVFFGNYRTHIHDNGVDRRGVFSNFETHLRDMEALQEGEMGLSLYNIYPSSDSYSDMAMETKVGTDPILINYDLNTREDHIVRIIPDGTYFPNQGISLPTGSEPSLAFTFLLTPLKHTELKLRLYFGGVFNPYIQVDTGIEYADYLYGAPMNVDENTVSTATLALKYSNAFITLGAFKKTYIDNVVIPYSMVTPGPGPGGGLSVETGGQETREYTLDGIYFNQTWEIQQ